MTTGNKKFDLQVKTLAIYQIAGGIIGLGFFILMISNQAFLLVPPFFFLSVIWIILFCYSIYCGVSLFKDPGKGLNFSMVNQILQTISVGFLGYIFKYVSGVNVSIGIDLTHSFELSFGAGISSGSIALNTNKELIFLDINFVALALVAGIEQLKKQWKKIDKEIQLSRLLAANENTGEA